MALQNVALAEEALSLDAAERAELAKLLIESLQDDGRSDEQIRVELKQRLDALMANQDHGLTYEEVFGTEL